MMNISKCVRIILQSGINIRAKSGSGLFEFCPIESVKAIFGYNTHLLCSFNILSLIFKYLSHGLCCSSMNYHKNKCFTQGSHLSDPKFANIWQILPRIALTLLIGQNSIALESSNSSKFDYKVWYTITNISYQRVERQFIVN